jgi:hypothetical protein
MIRTLRSMGLGFVYLISLNVLTAHAGPIGDNDYVLPVTENEIKIMSYNVQNLFNTTHDEDKSDYEFLPIKHEQKSKCGTNKNCLTLDWTDNKLAMKLDTIKDAIAGQGVLPDVLVLSEVENKDVVRRVAEHLGYAQFEMTNSPDARGIDLAILYSTKKLKLLEFIERPIEGLNFATRNLSAAIFSLNTSKSNATLAIFPNHWPSQARQNPNPRLTVADELTKFINDLKAEYATANLHYVITGDFNTVETEKPHPINNVLMSAGDLFDVRKMAIQQKHPLLATMPKATYYYGSENTWNEFDRFFVSKNLADSQGLDVNVMSYRIHAPSFLTVKEPKRGFLIPYRYNHYTTDRKSAGYSDHFGLVMKLGFY